MKSAAAFALGLMVALGGRPDNEPIRMAVAGYVKTTDELRATSARLRAMCQPPRVQRAPYRRDI